MDRRQLLVLGAGARAAPLACLAQLQGKVWRVGMLDTVSPTLNATNLDAFRQGLRDLGYVEGRIVIEYRTAEGKLYPGGRKATLWVEGRKC